MSYTIDIDARGFSLANAKECARASADAYVANPAAIVSSVDGTQVIITDCGNCILIAFEGSKNIKQFISDARAWWDNIDSCSIHAGFHRDALSLVPHIHAALSLIVDKPLVITGHSLGGALAQITAYLLSTEHKIHSVYTFGSPRVGDLRGVNLYGALANVTYRVTNGADIVPWTPGWLCGYRHTRTEIFLPSAGGIIGGPALWLKLGANLPELIREWYRREAALLTDHFILSYINRLNQL